MNNDRFANILGKEYNLFGKAIPHHEEFQEKIGKIIKDFSITLPNDELFVIDGGCGTGLTTLKILDADSRIKIVGIDNEEKTINQAEVILKDFKSRVKLQKEDLLVALKNMPNESVDIFASVWVIHNLNPQYRAQLFKEITRVLKSNGLFINGDKYAKDNKKTHQRDLEHQIKLFDVFETIGRSDLKKEWQAHYLEDEKIKISENEQIKILSNLGFKNIEIKYRKGMEAIIIAIR